MKPVWQGYDCSSTNEVAVFTVCEISDAGMRYYEISRKEFFISVIKDQPFF
jgi:hypothetical protein